MKKRIIALFFLSFLIILPADENTLEQLWETAKVNSKEVLNAQKTLDENIIQNKYRWSNYKPAAIFSSNSAFTDSWEDLKDKPSSMNAGLSLSHTLPGGLTLGSELSYGLSRSLYDPFSDPDIDNISYYHNTSASLSISQSLLPFWMQKSLKDPLQFQTSLTLTQAEEKKEAVQKQIVQAVTSCWIRMRLLSRSSMMNTLLIEYTDKKILDYEDLVSKGQIEKTLVWEEENTKQSYIKDKIIADNEYNGQLKQLLLVLGEKGCDVLDLDEVLFSALPESESSNSTLYNEIRILELQQEVLSQKQILLNQKYAPFIKLSSVVSCTSEENKKDTDFKQMWAEKKNWNWNINVSVDISSLFSREKKKEKELLEIESKNINQQVESLNEVAFIEKAYYTSYIESLNESLNITEKIRDNYKQKKEDYEVLYDNGDCTLLDVQTYSVQFLIRQLQIENIKDELWYYSWLLMNVD